MTGRSKNIEGYEDLTAYIAIQRVSKKEKKAMGKKKTCGQKTQKVFGGEQKCLIQDGRLSGDEVKLLEKLLSDGYRAPVNSI